MVLFFLVVLVVLGIGVTDILAFIPLNILNLLHLPQWLLWITIAGFISWLIGSD